MDICGASLDIGPTKRSSITQALATCEPHITASCAGLWPPPLLNCSENKRRQRVQSGVCFVCSHGGLPLDAFIISPSDATVPRGGDVTARSMSNMKEGRSGCQGVVGREYFNQKCPEMGGKKAPCGTFAYAPAHQASSNLGLEVWGMQIANHMLPFMSLSLFVSFSPSIWIVVKWTKCSANKGSIGILSTTLTARSSCGNVKQGWDERSVASGMKLLTPHFLSFPVLKLLLSQNVLYMCRSYLSSLVLFTRHQPEKHNTCYHANCFLWAICSAVAACSLFEPVPSVSPQIYFLVEYRGRRCYSAWLKVVL